jgi:EAL domain-containing protein (putative c-di-GMP-specific phosphodiesterase class I)
MAGHNTSVWHQFSPAHLGFAFQPIVSLMDGHIFGYECLARPMTTQGQPLSPQLLIHRALATGEAGALDRLLVERALTEARRRPKGRVFVNLLPQSVPEVAPFLLRQTLVPAPEVVLELVEERVGPGQLAESIKPLREAGYRVAVDDVGAGYSSLERLVAVRPDLAKVDISLVSHIDQDPVKYSLVEATVRFAQRTGIMLVAEGVETPGELATLQDLGIPYAQGYALGRPEDSFPEYPAMRPPERATRQGWAPEQSLDALLRLIHTASRGVSSGDGLADVLVATALALTGADLVTLMSVAHRPWRTVARAGRPAPSAIPVAWQTAIEARLDASPLTWQDVSGLDFPGRSGLVAPVTVNNRLAGLLAIGFIRPHQVRPDHLALAQALASLWALALTAGGHDPEP